MSAIERAKIVAKRVHARVVFPEIDDARIREATDFLNAEGLAKIVPLTPVSDAHVGAIMAVRPVKPAIAKRMLTRPLIHAAAMVAVGEADVMVAGIANPTKRVIEAASMAIGLADGITTPSSFFLIKIPDGRELIFADCALNVDPDAGQLADIARASSLSAKALLGQANVALLSFSTGTSGAGTSVDKVRAAAKATGFAGPLQADAALNAAIAATKGVIGGDANTLIFPNLDAGNIAYKLVQELAGAQAIGPLLQGFRRPVCDLSRGASVADIVNATLLTIALAQ